MIYMYWYFLNLSASVVWKVFFWHHFCSFSEIDGFFLVNVTEVKLWQLLLHLDSQNLFPCHRNNLGWVDLISSWLIYVDCYLSLCYFVDVCKSGYFLWPLWVKLYLNGSLVEWVTVPWLLHSLFFLLFLPIVKINRIDRIPSGLFPLNSVAALPVSGSLPWDFLDCMT